MKNCVFGLIFISILLISSGILFYVFFDFGNYEFSVDEDLVLDFENFTNNEVVTVELDEQGD